MMIKRKKTVFVGVSGGVDSSVSAALLKGQGYDVVGVFIRTWTPDFIECTWRDERRDAMRVCASLDIPFLECDAEEAYKNGVADYMIEEYKKGNTPNPDVMCNREVKFGIFWKFARERGADYIATGHYALNNCQLQTCLTDRQVANYELRKSKDKEKDQSYFLWTLTQEDLEHVLFPIGHLQKSEVRALARKFRVPTAEKKDSQGVCFLGPLDMKEFLKHYIEPQKGKVLDRNGARIGSHDGALFFTLGERHGFKIDAHSSSDMPLYVIAKDVKDNTITVDSGYHSPFAMTRAYDLTHVNWISGIPGKNNVYTAQIRYHGTYMPCSIDIKSTTEACITFEDPVLASRGQSIVVYENDLCLGGGIIV
ncbi:MAG: tRNA 2-thiouridine(34) synthase MnmA [Patescibacteria group bacterium]